MSVEKIIDMGFSEEEAHMSLRKGGGQLDVAVAWLLDPDKSNDDDDDGAGKAPPPVENLEEGEVRDPVLSEDAPKKKRKGKKSKGDAKSPRKRALEEAAQADVAGAGAGEAKHNPIVLEDDDMVPPLSSNVVSEDPDVNIGFVHNLPEKGGYGFLNYEGSKIFFHFNGLRPYHIPELGDLVEFSFGTNSRLGDHFGKLQAESVRLVRRFGHSSAEMERCARANGLSLTDNHLYHQQAKYHPSKHHQHHQPHRQHQHLGLAPLPPVPAALLNHRGQGHGHGQGQGALLGMPPPGQLPNERRSGVVLEYFRSNMWGRIRDGPSTVKFYLRDVQNSREVHKGSRVHFTLAFAEVSREPIAVNVYVMDDSWSFPPLRQQPPARPQPGAAAPNGRPHQPIQPPAPRGGPVAAAAPPVPHVPPLLRPGHVPLPRRMPGASADGPGGRHPVPHAQARYFLAREEESKEAFDRQSMSDAAAYLLGTKYPGDESRTTEFKHYVGANLLERIVQTAEKYVVAFLNAEGGTILFGVRDDGTIIGTHMSRKLRDDIRLALDSQLGRIHPALIAKRYNVVFHVVFDKRLGGRTIAVPDRRVLAITVESDRNGTDLYYDSQRNAWVRKDGSVRIMSASEVAQHVKSKVENQFKGVTQEAINKALARQKESFMEIFQNFKDQMKERAQKSVPSQPASASVSPDSEMSLVEEGASSSSSSSKSNVNAPDEDDEKKELSGEHTETPRSAPSDSSSAGFPEEVIKCLTQMFPVEKVLPALLELRRKGAPVMTVDDVERAIDILLNADFASSRESRQLVSPRSSSSSHMQDDASGQPSPGPRNEPETPSGVSLGFSLPLSSSSMNDVSSPSSQGNDVESLEDHVSSSVGLAVLTGTESGRTSPTSNILSSSLSGMKITEAEELEGATPGGGGATSRVASPMQDVSEGEIEGLSSASSSASPHSAAPVATEGSSGANGSGSSLSAFGQAADADLERAIQISLVERSMSVTSTASSDIQIDEDRSSVAPKRPTVVYDLASRASPTSSSSSSAPSKKPASASHTTKNSSPHNNHIRPSPSECDDVKGNGGSSSSSSSGSDSKRADADGEPMSDKYLVQSITVVNGVRRDDQRSEKSELQTDFESLLRSVREQYSKAGQARSDNPALLDDQPRFVLESRVNANVRAAVVRESDQTWRCNLEFNAHGRSLQFSSSEAFGDSIESAKTDCLVRGTKHLERLVEPKASPMSDDQSARDVLVPCRYCNIEIVSDELGAHEADCYLTLRQQLQHFQMYDAKNSHRDLLSSSGIPSSLRHAASAFQRNPEDEDAAAGGSSSSSSALFPSVDFSQNGPSSSLLPPPSSSSSKANSKANSFGSGSRSGSPRRPNKNKRKNTAEPCSPPPSALRVCSPSRSNSGDEASGAAASAAAAAAVVASSSSSLAAAASAPPPAAASSAVGGVAPAAAAEEFDLIPCERCNGMFHFANYMAHLQKCGGAIN